MYSYQPIAYYPPDSGTIVCPECARESGESAEWSVDFTGAEVDSPPTCDMCGCVMPEFTLTPDGIEYMRDMFAESGSEWRTIVREPLPPSLSPEYPAAINRWYNALMLIEYADQIENTSD